MTPRFHICSLVTICLATCPASRASDPELDRLKSAYNAASERALSPIKATYEKELQKLLQSHTKAGRLDAAAMVMSELKELGVVSTNPTPSNTPGVAASSASGRFFIGKSWYSNAGTDYHFNKDGTGTRLQKMDFPEKVTFTWRQLPDGMIEAMVRKQPNSKPTATFFRFVDRKTAFMGDSVANVEAPMRSEK